jgi:hypothetical protein
MLQMQIFDGDSRIEVQERANKWLAQLPKGAILIDHSLQAFNLPNAHERTLPIFYVVSIVVRLSDKK